MLDIWTLEQNLYKHRKNGSEESMENVKHTEDTLQSKLKKLKSDKEVLEKRKNRIIGHIKSIRPFGFPVLSDNDANKFVLNLYDSWAKYKEHVYLYWYKEDRVNRHMKNPDSDEWLFVGSYVIIILTVLIYGIVQKLSFGTIITTTLKLLIALDVLCGIASTWHYIIRPNRINKKNFKKELKATLAELKAIEANINATEGLIEARELASLKPEVEFTKVKISNYESLSKIVEYTKTQVIPKIDQSLSDIYSKIIVKAEKLLELGRENGKVITDVSKIYNIYINDINDILLNKSSKPGQLIEMLNNFESYVDRKIEKFSNIENMLVESEINALNKIFTGEEE